MIKRLACTCNETFWLKTRSNTIWAFTSGDKFMSSRLIYLNGRCFDGEQKYMNMCPPPQFIDRMYRMQTYNTIIWIKLGAASFTK